MLLRLPEPGTQLPCTRSNLTTIPDPGVLFSDHRTEYLRKGNGMLCFSVKVFKGKKSFTFMAKLSLKASDKLHRAQLKAWNKESRSVKNS